jgi:TrmH family RNA methyltransferase
MRDRSSLLISSASNPTIKQIRALAQRKERDARKLFFIEGIRIVTAACETGAPIETVVVAPELLTSTHGRTVARTLRQRGVPSLEVTGELFGRLSAKEGPQGLAAVVRQRWAPLDQAAPDTGLGWIALDAAQDPGNLGTILRTNDAVGGAGVILVGPTTDPHDPAAVRASMGALFAQQLVRTGFAELAAWKRRHGVFMVGTSDKAATDYQALRYPQPTVLLMGSEQKGLSAEQQALCDAMVRIPMVGRSDSLNLAVATGVLLYEIFNQHRAASRHEE